MARMLPTGCFHVVLTLPSELRGLARRNPRELYDLLFHAGSDALMTLGRDPRRLGGLIGITSVLHTWRRDQAHHPHLHCIVPGGALTTTPEGDARWIDAGRDHLFPVKVVGKLFRGKYLAGLQRLLDKGALDLPPELGAPSARAALLAHLHRTRWVVHCKRPFAGAEQVYKYLGRYTHRVGLSNNRILHLDHDSVTISTRDGRTATMPPAELLERFLQHVLPRGYVKIRHYGLHASGNLATRLPAARAAIEARHVEARGRPNRPPPSDWRDRLKALVGVDLRRCRACGGTRVERLVMCPPSSERSSRGPPDQEGPP